MFKVGELINNLQEGASRLAELAGIAKQGRQIYNVEVDVPTCVYQDGQLVGETINRLPGEIVRGSNGRIINNEGKIVLRRQSQTEKKVKNYEYELLYFLDLVYQGKIKLDPELYSEILQECCDLYPKATYIRIDIPSISKDGQPKGDVPLPAKIVLSDEDRVIRPDGKIVISRLSRSAGNRITEFEYSAEEFLNLLNAGKIVLIKSIYLQILEEYQALARRNDQQKIDQIRSSIRENGGDLAGGPAIEQGITEPYAKVYETTNGNILSSQGKGLAIYVDRGPREEQEDRVMVGQVELGSGIFVTCMAAIDGVGGEEGGEIAAQCFAESLRDVFANELPKVDFNTFMQRLRLNNYEGLNLQFGPIIRDAEEQALRKLEEVINKDKKYSKASAAYTVAFVIYDKNRRNVSVLTYTRGDPRVFVITRSRDMTGTNRVNSVYLPEIGRDFITDYFATDLTKRQTLPLPDYWGELSPEGLVVIATTDGVYGIIGDTKTYGVNSDEKRKDIADRFANMALNNGSNSSSVSSTDIAENILNRVRGPGGRAVEDNRSMAVYVPAEQGMTDPKIISPTSTKSGLSRVFDFFKKRFGS